MSSKAVPEATPIDLTSDERAELDRLVRSTRTEHRTRFKARIVLLAAAGAATRAVARVVGCTTGTASKWRVRYAKDRPMTLPVTTSSAANRVVVPCRL